MRKMRSTHRMTLPVAATLATGLLLLSGCRSGTTAAIYHDPTPAIDTLSETDFEVKNSLVITRENNFRMVWEDLGRLWLVDRPSRLSPKPIPY